MKIRNYIFFVTTIICIFNNLTYSLYEDQIGKFDWAVQLIGKPTFVQYIHNGQALMRVVIASERNVLAVLNGKNGALGWRHVFEKSSAGKIDDIKVSGQNIVLSFAGGIRIRCFNLITGLLQWESSVATSDHSHASTLQVFGRNPGYVALSTKNNLTLINLENGNIKWSSILPKSDSSTHSYLSYADTKLTVVKVTPSNLITIHGYDIDQTTLFHKEFNAPWVSKDKKLCTVAHNANLACLDVTNKMLYTLSFNNLQASFVQYHIQEDIKSPSFETLEIVGNSILVLKVKVDMSLVFLFDDEHIDLIYTLKGPSALQTMVYAGDVVLGSLSRKSSEMLEFSAYSLTTKAELKNLKQTFKFPSHHGRPLEMYGGNLKKDTSTNKLVYSFLIISEDESIVSVQQSGKFMWTREESLSSIVSTEMVDLPVSKIMAKMEDEFGVEEGVIQMFAKRFFTQFSQLKTFILQLKHQLKLFHHSHHHHHHHQAHNQANEEDEDDEDGGSDDNDTLDESYLTRDEFNLHKLIIVVTSAGKIFGIDSNTGKNIWKIFVEDLAPFQLMAGELVLPLFVQRTSSHFPHQPVCSVIGLSKSTGKSQIFSFHPISGTPAPLASSPSSDHASSSAAATKGELLPYKLLNVVMLAQFDNHFLHPLLLLDDNNKIHVVPNSATEQVRKLSSSLFTFLADKDKGVVNGYRVVPGSQESLLAQSTWTVNVGMDGQVISGMYSKHANEHVHSIGIVLEDRSVLYKYLNPNLVVVVTEGEDVEQKEVLQKATFSVHLIDGVTGDLIFHCTHKKSKGPVHVVHSENWIMYNYWNQKHRRNELAILELYEGDRQSNASAFSSLHHPPQPIVMRQAYIFPGHVTTMGVTLTEKGLTSKELLFALESGSLLGLPKIFIDPRRPEVVSPESREEGLIPYMPELPRPPDRIINYHQLVHDIKHIKTSPAGLESTSLVFCYGLDLFFTRVTPSKMFDVLKEDFDYFFISSVLIGMIVVSVVSQKLASRKLLHRAWK